MQVAVQIVLLTLSDPEDPGMPGIRFRQGKDGCRICVETQGSKQHVASASHQTEKARKDNS
jgi:hypothetical protein